MAKTGDSEFGEQEKKLEKLEEHELRLLFRDFNELKLLLEQVREAKEGKKEVKAILQNLRKGRWGGLVKGEEKIERRIARDFHELKSVVNPIVEEAAKKVAKDPEWSRQERKLSESVKRLNILDARLIDFGSRGGKLEKVLQAAETDKSNLKEAESIILKAIETVRGYEVELGKLMKQNEQMRTEIFRLKKWSLYFTDKELKTIHYLLMRVIFGLKNQLDLEEEHARSRLQEFDTFKEIRNLLRSDAFYPETLERIIKIFKPVMTKLKREKYSQNQIFPIAYLILEWLRNVSIGRWSSEDEIHFKAAGGGILDRLGLKETASSRKEIYEGMVHLCEYTLSILEKEGEYSHIKLKRAKKLDELFDDIYSS